MSSAAGWRARRRGGKEGSMESTKRKALRAAMARFGSTLRKDGARHAGGVSFLRSLLAEMRGDLEDLPEDEADLPAWAEEREGAILRAACLADAEDMDPGMAAWLERTRIPVLPAWRQGLGTAEGDAAADRLSGEALDRILALAMGGMASAHERVELAASLREGREPSDADLPLQRAVFDGAWREIAAAGTVVAFHDRKAFGDGVLDVACAGLAASAWARLCGSKEAAEEWMAALDARLERRTAETSDLLDEAEAAGFLGTTREDLDRRVEDGRLAPSLEPRARLSWRPERFHGRSYRLADLQRLRETEGGGDGVSEGIEE